MPTKQGPRIEHSTHHSMHLAQVTWGGWEGKERRRREVREGLGIKDQEDNSGWDGLAVHGTESPSGCRCLRAHEARLWVCGSARRRKFTNI